MTRQNVLKLITRALLITVLVGLILGGIWIYYVARLIFWKPAENDRIPYALEMGRLANLPPAAAEIRWTGFWNPFASETVITFIAPPKQIESFIRNSPGLREAKPIPLPYKSQSVTDTVYFDLERSELAKETPGRGYIIPWDNSNHGCVIVNDVTQTVYIVIGHS